MDWKAFAAEGDGTKIMTTWEREGVHFAILKIGDALNREIVRWSRIICEASDIVIPETWYCGYAAFHGNPLASFGTDGHYDVSVHGGVTLSEDFGEWHVFGFDCAHWRDDSNPKCRNLNWIVAECERMAESVCRLVKEANDGD